MTSVLPAQGLNASSRISPNRISSRVRVPRAARLQPCTMARSATQTRVTKKEAIKDAIQDVRDLIKSKHCNPIVVRLAWHDAGTYDKNISEWPKRGGANGSIRFKPEQDHNANSGLVVALDLLNKIAESHDGVSYADLYQMASAQAIELAGGPHIPLRYGRRDVDHPDGCSVDGNLPAGGPPYPNGEPKAGDHLRRVFYRMGLSDKDIVALSGAHTLGRSRPERSGFGKKETKYTKNGPGTPGGSSWTVEWLKFDNSYFTDIKAQSDPELLVLDTDNALFVDEEFRPYAEKYAADQDAFFQDYVESHLKLSELGVEWVTGDPIVL